MSGLSWSPVEVLAAGGVGGRGAGGDEVFTPVPVPAFQDHEVVLPPVVSRSVDVGEARVRVDDLPVTIRVAEPAVVADRGLGVRVESLPVERVEALGGEVFGVGVSPLGVVAPMVVEVEIDYSAFRYALGGDWASRLGVVRFDCSPERAGRGSCASGVRVDDVVNDLAAGVLTVRVPLGGTGISGGSSRPARLTSGDGSTLLLESSTGSFAATSLSNTGSWRVGGNRGAFSYSYPFAMPPAFNGLGPSVSLEYSSAVANGMTASVNSQASQVGVGWDLSAGQGLIERRYVGCGDSRFTSSFDTSDQCWFGQNATITLNGRSSELVPMNGTTGSANSFTEFRLKDDPDWLVQRVPGTGAAWWQGESWVVTTPEGTRYYFGRDQEGQASRLTIPVRGRLGSDPCASLTAGMCLDMPYRWMLDEVVDAFGNRMLYRYSQELNWARSYAGNVLYAADAVLTSVEYGASPRVTPAIGFTQRVRFGYVDRCVAALSDPTVACPTVSNANGTSYPDTPTDLVCTGTALCTKWPSFFSTKRLATVTTETVSGTGAWVPVREWRLFGSFPDPGDGTNEKLWLFAVAPVTPGTGTQLSPGVIFGGTAFRNRDDAKPVSGVPYTNVFRLTDVLDELGARTQVVYQHNGCPKNPNYPAWSSNTTDCFPRWEYNGPTQKWEPGIYRMWVVDKVIETDQVTVGTGTGAAPPVVTDYSYGAPGWRREETQWWEDPVGIGAQRPYDDFRGYDLVNTTIGAGTVTSSSTQIFYRGMNGSNGATVTMSRWWTPTAGGDGAPSVVYDQEWLSGQVWESYSWDPIGGGFHTASRNYFAYTSTMTGVSPRSTYMPADTIQFSRLTLIQTRFRDGTAAAPVWRDRRVDHSIDALGRTYATNSTGFVDAIGDETCDGTWFIDGSTRPTATTPGWMNLVAQTATWSGLGTQPVQSPYVAGGCSGVPVSVSRQFYNSNPYATGTQANSPMTQPLSATLSPAVTASMTRLRNNTPGSDDLDRWRVTRNTVDAAGRINATFDPAGNQTVYGRDAVYGYVATTTGPIIVAGTALSTSTVIRPGDGQPTSSTDVNGRTSFYCYDSLSRLTAGYAPPADGSTLTNPCAGTSGVLPDMTVTYSIGNYVDWWTSKEPAIVTTTTYSPDNDPIISAAFIDGYGRTRETQTTSAVDNMMVVTANLFDDRANTTVTYDAFAVTDIPGDRTSANNTNGRGFVTWPNVPTTGIRTNTTSYDNANRPTTVTRRWENTVLFSTTTSYDGTLTTITPQVGQRTATRVDGLGRVIRVDTFDGTTIPTGAGTLTDNNTWHTTTYTVDTTTNTVSYDRRGYSTVTSSDEGGNATITVTDLAGQAVTTTDPDAGTTTATYDANGNLTRSVDAANNVVNTTFDALGRPVGRWSGTTAASFAAASTAQRLASWTYDTVTNGRGRPATETSWQNGQQYVTAIDSYDARGHATATSVTVPGVYGTDLLAGVWKYTTTYTTSGAVRTVGSPTQPVDPTVGGTPGFEYTTTGYNRIGQPDSQWPTATPSPLPGVGLVEGTVFDPLGRVTSRLLSTTGGGGMVQQFAYQTDTGRLASSSVGFGTLAAVSSVFVNDQYSYDLRGNVTAIIDGGKEPSGVASGVKECFLYDTRDRLIRAHTATITGTCATTTASTSTAAGTLAAYDTRWTFDDLGRTRTVRDMLAAATVTYNYTTSRHAITSLTGAATAAYTYNPVGAMTTRNTTALGYDAMQRLTSYGSIDTNLYRASNQRLIRTSGTTRTLYVPGMDVTVSAGVRTITRTLTIDGTPYGTRTLAGGATATMWNCTNPQHTLACTTPAGSTSIPPRTRYSPYGTPRTTTTITNTDRGHLNQPHDPTGLTYLNNRYYDPNINAFTTVDPLVGKTGTPYLYAGGNPTTFSDPSGLCREGDAKCGVDYNGQGLSSSPRAPQIGASNLVVPPSASVARFRIPVWEGAGVTRFQFFIDDDRVCLSGTGPDFACGHGDARGFASGGALSDYNLGARVRIVLNHETGSGTVIAYATHGDVGDIDALPINLTLDGGFRLPEDYPSQFRLYTRGEGIDGNIVFDYRFINSETPKSLAGAAPAINGAVRLQRGPHNTVQIDGRLAQYPSVEVIRDYQLPNGYWSTLILAKPQESGGPLSLYELGEKFVAAG